MRDRVLLKTPLVLVLHLLLHHYNFGELPGVLGVILHEMDQLTYKGRIDKAASARPGHGMAHNLILRDVTRTRGVSSRVHRVARYIILTVNGTNHSGPCYEANVMHISSFHIGLTLTRCTLQNVNLLLSKAHGKACNELN